MRMFSCRNCKNLLWFGDNIFKGIILGVCMKVKKVFIATIVCLAISFFLNMFLGALVHFCPGIMNVPELPWIITGIMGLLIAILIIFLCRYKISIFNKKNIVAGLIYSLPLFLFSFYFCCRAINWIFGEHYSIYSPEIKTVFVMNLLSCFMVGIYEELLFRGFLLNYLLSGLEKTKGNYVYAIIVSSLIFGLSHIFIIFFYEDILYYQILTIVLAIPLGFFLAVIYLKTKSYILVAILHFLWNYTSFCDNQMSMNRFTVLSKYDFTNYQIPILIIMTIIAIIVLLRSSVDELEL